VNDIGMPAVTGVDADDGDSDTAAKDQLQI